VTDQEHIRAITLFGGTADLKCDDADETVVSIMII